MKAYRLTIKGNFGHFRMPEANNNPITYGILTKTALIGIMGAVVGLSRTELRSSYSELSTNVYYNVKLLNSVSKIIHGFRIYKYKGSLTRIEFPPQNVEVLKNPYFEIILSGESEILTKFIDYIKANKAVYTPTLGLINCPAEINFLEEFELEEVRNVEIIHTEGFIPSSENIQLKNSKETIYYENIPVAQDDNWMNTKYQEIYYAFSPENSSISVAHPSKVYKEKLGEKEWFLI